MRRYLGGNPELALRRPPRGPDVPSHVSYNVSSEIIRGATRGRKSELDYPEVHLRREQKSNGVSVSLVWATSFCYNLSNQDFEERAQ